MPTLCKKPRDRKRSRDRDDDERASRRRERRAPETALPCSDDHRPADPAPEHA